MVLPAMLAIGVIAFAQLEQYKGNSINRYENHHTGNKVGTIFYNYGLVANVNEQSCEWPLGTGDEYVGDVTPLVGIEFVHPNGDTLHSIITCSSPRMRAPSRRRPASGRGRRGSTCRCWGWWWRCGRGREAREVTASPPGSAARRSSGPPSGPRRTR